MTTQITFSVRTNNEELLEKLDKDAKEQRRSRNFIINDILLKNYKLIGDSD
jgi:predicted transcriptional regulator